MKQPGKAVHWLLRAKTVSDLLNQSRLWTDYTPDTLASYSLESLSKVILVDKLDVLHNRFPATVGTMWQGLAVLLSFATVMGLA